MGRKKQTKKQLKSSRDKFCKKWCSNKLEKFTWTKGQQKETEEYWKNTKEMIIDLLSEAVREIPNDFLAMALYKFGGITLYYPIGYVGGLNSGSKKDVEEAIEDMMSKTIFGKEKIEVDKGISKIAKKFEGEYIKPISEKKDFLSHQLYDYLKEINDWWTSEFYREFFERPKKEKENK